MWLAHDSHSFIIDNNLISFDSQLHNAFSFSGGGSHRPLIARVRIQKLFKNKKLKNIYKKNKKHKGCLLFQTNLSISCGARTAKSVVCCPFVDIYVS